MKTILPMGWAVLLVTIASLLGAGLVLCAAMNARWFSMLHWLVMALFFLFPLILRRRRITIEGLFLTCQGWVFGDVVQLKDIERIKVAKWEQSYVLEIYKANYQSAAIECELSCFHRHEIKSLLGELQTTHPTLDISVSPTF